MATGAAVTLLESMARGRIEWLAQGLLVHALQIDDGVHDLVATKCGVTATRGDLLSVEEERPAAAGWRSDVCINWRGQAERRVELKIAADLSPNQVKALGTNSVSLLVAPSPWLDRAGAELQVARVSWDELAKAAADRVVQSLLSQAEEAGSAARKRITAVEATRSFEGFLGGKDWPAMYRFLVAVDRALSDVIGPRYVASTQWSFTRGAEVPYYGFSFVVGDAAVSYWIGFARDPGDAAPSLRVTRSAPFESPWKSFDWKKGDLTAVDVAQAFRSWEREALPRAW